MSIVRDVTVITTAVLYSESSN